jgi:hypothetical protein
MLKTMLCIYRLVQILKRSFKSLKDLNKLHHVNILHVESYLVHNEVQ